MLVTKNHDISVDTKYLITTLQCCLSDDKNVIITQYRKKQMAKAKNIK
jgi:hypothetical protein